MNEFSSYRNIKRHSKDMGQLVKMKNSKRKFGKYIMGQQIAKTK